MFLYSRWTCCTKMKCHKHLCRCTDSTLHESIIYTSIGKVMCELWGREERECIWEGEILNFKLPGRVVECQRKSVWGWRERERGEGGDTESERGREPWGVVLLRCLLLIKYLWPWGNLVQTFRNSTPPGCWWKFHDQTPLCATVA